MKNQPIDKKLYRKVVREAKQKFMVWPSAYASGWVVKTYKARGGKYKTIESQKKTADTRPLDRWYKQNWVNVCAYVERGVLESCGRHKAQWQDYPYCRPEKRISPQTPMTLSEILEKLGKTEIIRRCQQKRRNPREKIY